MPVRALEDLKLSVSKQTVLLDESFEIQIQFINPTVGQDLSVSIADTPGFEHVEILRTTDRRSSYVQVINGEQTSTGTYALQLQVLPISEGSFTLGPVSVQSNDQIIQSNVVTLEVVHFIDSLHPNQPDEKQDLYWWVGVLVGIGMIGMLVGAFMKNRNVKDAPVLIEIDNDTLCQQVTSCETMDQLFFFLQEYLVHIYGPDIRSQTGSELLASIDQEDLKDLVINISKNRYNPNQSDTFSEMKESFISYLKQHGDG